MVADGNISEHLGASADIDMPADNRGTASGQRAQRDLLEDQAVRSNAGVRMDNNAIGMRQQQTTAKLTG